MLHSHIILYPSSFPIGYLSELFYHFCWWNHYVILLLHSRQTILHFLKPISTTVKSISFHMSNILFPLTPLSGFLSKETPHYQLVYLFIPPQSSSNWMTTWNGLLSPHFPAGRGTGSWDYNSIYAVITRICSFQIRNVWEGLASPVSRIDVRSSLSKASWQPKLMSLTYPFWLLLHLPKVPPQTLVVGGGGVGLGRPSPRCKLRPRPVPTQCLPKYKIQCLQYVLSSTARLVTLSGKHDWHIASTSGASLVAIWAVRGI